MKLSASQAQRVNELFDSIDIFYAHTANKLKVHESMDDSVASFKVRSAWSRKPNFVNKFIALNRSKLSADDIAIISQWNTSVQAQFIAVKQYDEYALLYNVQDSLFYAVLALDLSIEQVIKQSLPAFIETRLFPYKDSIICDGIIKCWTTSPKEDEQMWDTLVAESEQMIAKNCIMTQLGGHVQREQMLRNVTHLRIEKYLARLQQQYSVNPEVPDQNSLL